MNKKVKFDAKNDQHLLHFESFMRTGAWGLCPFELEENYESIPGMILHKIAFDRLEDCSWKKFLANTENE